MISGRQEQIKRDLLLSCFFRGTIASLAAFATLIFTTVLAGVLIVSPVAGLRPNLDQFGTA